MILLRVSHLILSRYHTQPDAYLKKSGPYREILSEVTEEVSPVLAFIDALCQLRRQAPELGIDFDERSPTLAALLLEENERRLSKAHDSGDFRE
jgi:hypothetical protein